MRLPSIQGIIRRRVLVNYRVDAEAMQRLLPAPFRPKLHGGHAIAGICLIRLEQLRPRGLPPWCGLPSENAAHRVAVVWETPAGESREGVYIPRRDTGSWLAHLAGGRLFPGEHHLADFTVTDAGERIALSVHARDGGMSLHLRAHAADALPSESCFASLADASAFFEGGCVGYSATRAGDRLDGLRLEVDDWQVRPLTVEHVESSFFADASAFPAGSVVFDHALVMRDRGHRWQAEPDLIVG